MCLIFLFFLFFSSSCQKKQVVQIPVENPINQVQEKQEEKSIPSESEPETVEEKKPPIKDIPFSSPNLNLSYKKYFIKNDEEYGHGENYKFFVPLQIKKSQFEYTMDQNLVRFNLKTKTEKVYKDVFQNISITDPLEIPGEWIVVENNRYYYTESTMEGELESRFAICKDSETLKIIWRTKLFQKDPEYSQYINNKIMHNDRYIFVAFKENLRCYCIEMSTGKLIWTYDTFSTFPYLDNEYLGDCESAKSWQCFYITHVFSKGIVLDLLSDVDNSKVPNNLIGESIKKRIVVSMDGKFINELDSEVIIYLEDFYLYENGCKSLIDNKIQWNGILKFAQDEVMRFHKKNNVTINPYIYTTNNKVFYVHNGKKESIVMVFDNKSGNILWKKQLQNTNIVATIEKDSMYYVFYQQKDKGFLLIYDIKTSKEKTIPIVFNKENPDFYLDYNFIKESNQYHIFFTDSMLSFNEEKGLYQSLFSKKELDNYYMMRDFGGFREPYFLSNENYFVAAYHPGYIQRGLSRGGGFIVLEKK